MPDRRGLPGRRQRPVRRQPRAGEPVVRAALGRLGLPRHRRGTAVRLPGRAGSALSSLGIDTNPAAPDPADLPQAEQTAIGKCTTISQEFTDAVGKGPLAGILALSNDIASDVRKDAAVKNATQQWSACMARNGYTYSQPEDVFFDQIQKMFGGKRQISFGATVSNAANQAQIAAAVTDATCTGSADLAGIYFAVQASYEQQIVNANAQALNSAVQQYKAAYAKELKKLPDLLKTAKASQFPGIRPTRKG